MSPLRIHHLDAGRSHRYSINVSLINIHMHINAAVTLNNPSICQNELAARADVFFFFFAHFRLWSLALPQFRIMPSWTWTPVFLGTCNIIINARMECNRMRIEKILLEIISKPVRADDAVKHDNDHHNQRVREKKRTRKDGIVRE